MLFTFASDRRFGFVPVIDPIHIVDNCGPSVPFLCVGSQSARSYRTSSIVNSPVKRSASRTVTGPIRHSDST